MKMRHVLVVLLVLGLSTALWAQGEGGDSPLCTDSRSFWDKGCTTDSNCPPTDASCTVYNFTPACTGDYIIDAWTACTGTNCGHCRSCVAVYDATFMLARCVSDNCPDACTRTCGTVHLTAGHSYTVRVCLSPCPGFGDCATCSDTYGCMAWGCLRYGQAAPCW
jgi:hypothetical protein